MPFIRESLFAMVGSANDFRVPDRWDEVGKVYDDVLKALEQQQDDQNL